METKKKVECNNNLMFYTKILSPEDSTIEAAIRKKEKNIVPFLFSFIPLHFNDRGENGNVL